MKTFIGFIFIVLLFILITRLGFILLQWAVGIFGYDLQFIQYMAILVIIGVIKYAIK